MKIPKLARFGLQRGSLLAIVAEHRLVSFISTSRLITLLTPRERLVADYMIATPVEQRKMKLSPELKEAASILIRWCDKNHRTLKSPS